MTRLVTQVSPLKSWAIMELMLLQSSGTLNILPIHRIIEWFGLKRTLKII